MLLLIVLQAGCHGLVWGNAAVLALAFGIFFGTVTWTKADSHSLKPGTNAVPKKG